MKKEITNITPADPKNPEFFVYSFYQVSGRPKCEELVMAYARLKFEYQIIPGYMLPLVVDELKQYAEAIIEKNKRLSPVDIYVSKPSYCSDGVRSIHIGAQCVRMLLIKGKVE